MSTRTVRSRWAGTSRPLAIGAIAFLLSAASHAASRIEGHVFDLNGHALQQAMVTLAKEPGQQGPAAVTVFTDENGRFSFPEGTSRGTVAAQMLGYRALEPAPRTQGDAGHIEIIMRPDANQAGIAPASAWLAHIADE